MRSCDDYLIVKPTSRTNPFCASIKERYCLNRPGSGKCTVHVVLDLSGSDIIYLPGDSIGVFPLNHPELVQRCLDALKAHGSEPVTSREGESLSIRDFLTTKANIQAPTKKLLGRLDPTSPLLKDRKDFKELMARHELWDFLELYPEHSLKPEELPSLLLGLLPRLYSIASSPSVVGREIHLTIATLSYTTGGIQRHGTCSDYLWQQAPLNSPSIPIYLQSSKDFRLPNDEQKPIIMIGPGTGIAPFRAFLQERLSNPSTGQNWLFFGERNEATDFYYREELETAVDEGTLRISTAFSRDQKEKIYVQDLMKQQAAELWSWIEQGAILYVCGDKDKMAKDVDSALHSIVESEGGLPAKEFMRSLRKAGRYLRDVY